MTTAAQRRVAQAKKNSQATKNDKHGQPAVLDRPNIKQGRKNEEDAGKQVKATTNKKRSNGQKSAAGHRRIHVKKSGVASVQVGKQTVAILTGAEDLSLWTDEDLIKGWRGGKSGRGRPPHMIPREVYDELSRRIVSRTQHQFMAELEIVARKLIRVIDGIKESKVKVDGHFIWVVKPEDITPLQMKAMDMLLDRVLGKPKERVDIKMEVTPGDELLASAIVPNWKAAKELEEGLLIEDAEIVEEEDEELT